jgi:putative transposase
MKVIKSYKFRFYPTADQIVQLDIEFNNARFVWNHSLEMRTKAYKRRKESINYVGLSKHTTHLKRTSRFGWLKNSTADVLTQKLIDQDKAFKNFFAGRAKYPRFKKKSHNQSIRYALEQRQITNNYRSGEVLKLPKLGKVDIKWSQVPKGAPKMVTVSRTSSGLYFISFSCAVEIESLPKTGRIVGVDMGIKDVVVTSEGYYSGSPKFGKKNEKRLKKAQRILSRRIKGSKRWHKQRIVVARIYDDIVNSRKDFTHKLTTKLVRENDVIFIEDLNVSGMMKNRKLSKAVADIGIYELRRQLEYKAAWYGRKVSIVSRWFPSTRMCSGCGQLHDMTLNDRVMICDCGLTIDRDLNAAINIKTAGIVVRGASSSDVEQVAT